VKLVVIGAGGHAKVVTDTARCAGWEVVGFVDDRPDAQLFDLTYLGITQNFQMPQQTQGVIAIGDNKTREKIVAQLSGHIDWATVIHPQATVSSYSKVGAGTVVFAGVVVQADTRLGHHCIVNTLASIDHDCQIADFCHIAPQAVLTGHVRLETGAFVGAGAVVLPGRRIGAWSTLGAGAIVVNDLDSNGVFIGIPAKRIVP
jgi:sugar O-acyltransferase (sialic acid O-acetyltransferase NeuD family)